MFKRRHVPTTTGLHCNIPVLKRPNLNIFCSKISTSNRSSRDPCLNQFVVCCYQQQFRCVGGSNYSVHPEELRTKYQIPGEEIKGKKNQQQKNGSKSDSTKSSSEQAEEDDAPPTIYNYKPKHIQQMVFIAIRELSGYFLVGIFAVFLLWSFQDSFSMSAKAVMSAKDKVRRGGGEETQSDEGKEKKSTTADGPPEKKRRLYTVYPQKKDWEA